MPLSDTITLSGMNGYGMTGTFGRVGRSGMVARDLSRFDSRKSVREAYKKSVASAPAAAIPRVQQKSSKKAKSQITFFSVFSFIAIVSLCFATISGYVQINEIATETSKASSLLTKLKNDEVSLRNNIEKKLNLKVIEDRAKALGMIKPDREQIVYLNMSGGDKAKVLRSNSENPGIFASISTGTSIFGLFMS